MHNGQRAQSSCIHVGLSIDERHCVTTRNIRRVSLLSFREQTHWIVADVSEYSDKVGLQ